MQRIAVISSYSSLLCAWLMTLSLVATAANREESFTFASEGLLFSLAGSNTVGAHLAPAWAKAYLEAKGAQGVFIEPLATANEYRVKGRNGTRMVYIDILAHGSSTGFKGLRAKTAEIALSSRQIKAAEAKFFNIAGGMQASSSEHVVAIDGLAVVVNPDNPLSTMTVTNIAKIFSGKISNWKALGGPDRRINLYARDDKSGTYDTFKSLVLRKNANLSSRAKRFESNDELSDTVANDLGGIGFVGLASVRNAKALAVSDDNTVALKPEILFVATEDYPLSRRLFMYTRGQSDVPFVNEFIRFAQGLAGQNIVEVIGFVSQNPKGLASAVSKGPERYQELAGVMQRLSVNFRFQPGKADLDNKALQDVERLARFMQQGRGDKAENINIQLVGFSNVESSEKRAQVLSRLRATAVKSALYRFDVQTESVIGFGDTMRVANAEGASSAKNERVEVWFFADKHLSAVNAVKDKIKRGELMLPKNAVSSVLN